MNSYDRKMMSLLEKLKEYDDKILKVENELKSLSDQYLYGHTLQQQMTMFILMRNDLNYKNERKILESKISVLRAEREKCYTDGRIEISRFNDIV